MEYSPAPEFDLDEEFALQQKVAQLIKNKVIASAHDVSEGGLFIALIESCFNRNLGMDVVAADSAIRKDAYWFGEGQSRVVVTVSSGDVPAFKKLMADHPYAELGAVTRGSIEVDGMDWGNISTWKDKYDNAIANILGTTAADEAMAAL